MKIIHKTAQQRSDSLKLGSIVALLMETSYTEFCNRHNETILSAARLESDSWCDFDAKGSCPSAAIFVTPYGLTDTTQHDRTFLMLYKSHEGCATVIQVVR
jgi:hypothetical protein